MKVKNLMSVVLGFIFLGLIGYALWGFLGSLFEARDKNKTSIEASGRIEGTEYHAASKITGRVDEIFVQEGEGVLLNQKIAKINSPQLKAMINQAEANLRKSEASSRLVEADFKRYQRLLEDEAVPRSEYEHVENKYLLGKEDVLASQKELERLKADLEDTVILAPVSGKVISRIVQPGEVIAAGTPIVTIINMDELYLKVFLPTEIAGKISIGDSAKVFPDALGHEEFLAFVDKISQKAEFTPKNVETKSQRAKLVFEVRLKIKENRAQKLKPGMPAEAIIEIAKPK